jgi:hypothetical protein
MVVEKLLSPERERPQLIFSNIASVADSSCICILISGTINYMCNRHNCGFETSPAFFVGFHYNKDPKLTLVVKRRDELLMEPQGLGFRRPPAFLSSLRAFLCPWYAILRAGEFTIIVPAPNLHMFSTRAFLALVDGLLYIRETAIPPSVAGNRAPSSPLVGLLV